MQANPFFFFTDPAPTAIYTLSLHDALPICSPRGAESRHGRRRACSTSAARPSSTRRSRSEEHTSELQSLRHLVCRLLLEKKKSSNRPYVQETGSEGQRHTLRDQTHTTLAET